MANWWCSLWMSHSYWCCFGRFLLLLIIIIISVILTSSTLSFLNKTNKSLVSASMVSPTRFPANYNWPTVLDRSLCYSRIQFTWNMIEKSAIATDWYLLFLWTSHFFYSMNSLCATNWTEVANSHGSDKVKLIKSWFAINSRYAVDRCILLVGCERLRQPVLWPPLHALCSPNHWRICVYERLLLRLRIVQVINKWINLCEPT